MKTFYEEVIDGITAQAFLENIKNKYHYQNDQLTDLIRAARELLPLLRQDAHWEHRIIYGELFGGKFWRDLSAPETLGDQCITYSEVVMTLGEGPDLLQEQYLSQGHLSECYMVESLTSELLLQGYAAYNRYIAENTDFHVARYHFPGSEDAFPLNCLPEILERIKLPVRCNKAFCMIPKKSVVFVAELTQDKPQLCQGICVGCTSINCPNRMEDDSQIGRMDHLWREDQPHREHYSMF